MEYYDIIIIGAGIAGCGLAYNLKRFGYKGSVLIIDKNNIGANAAYGYRNTFKEIIDEYNLPYVEKYKGVKIGDHKKILAKIECDFFFLDYKETCEYLLKKSQYKLKREEALEVSENTIRTEKKLYKFKYLIDCTGPSFFLKKQFKMPTPFKYYIGELNVYGKNQIKNLDKEYFYYHGDPAGYVEDYYIFKDKVIQGDWQITNKVNFQKIRSPPCSFMNQYQEKPKSMQKSWVVAPVSPVFPMVYKNYAFLGDSFGNATSSVGEGIRPILDSSKILVRAIKNGNLKSYEKIWKKKYFNIYVRYMAARIDLKRRFEITKVISQHQDLLLGLLKNEKINIPFSLLKKCPKIVIIKTIYYYYLIKLKYIIDSLKFKIL